MSKDETKKQIVTVVNQRGNFHDRFARVTVGDVHIARDILELYADPVISRLINLDKLQPFTTELISDDLRKELRMDISFVSQFRDEIGRMGAFFAIEHKSRPSYYVLLQLAGQAILAIHKMWSLADYTNAKSFKPPVPIMVLLYCGKEDWDMEELRFQDIFEHIPEELKEFVIQFRVVVVNLKRFHYGKLPGRPETQAAVESMKRATDGTFVANLTNIVSPLGKLPMDLRIESLIKSIISYASWSEGMTEEQFNEAIFSIWKGQEGIVMAETIQKGIVEQCMEKAVARIKIEDILAILEDRYKQVPSEIRESLNEMSDPIALKSLLVHAASCKSLEDFADSL